MKKIFALISVVLFLAAFPAKAVTPEEVLNKTATKITKAKGVSCKFTITVDGNLIRGTLESQGKRFKISTPESTIWYDGKTMWTMNRGSEEVTVTTPTAEEINEVNPLSYVHGYSSTYRIYFSSRKEAGKYLVLLNPRSKNTSIKAVEIDIHAKSYVPEKLIVRFTDDRRSTINISNINYNAALSAVSFTFPSEKYKGYEIVDLR